MTKKIITTLKNNLNEENMVLQNKNKENKDLKLKTKQNEKRGISADSIFNSNINFNNKKNKEKSEQKFITINVNKTDKPKSVKTKRIKINFSNNINIGSGGKNLFHSIYEPRLYNERILKKWEESSHKDWYQLSPKSRAIANEEMEKIKISVDEEIKKLK